MGDQELLNEVRKDVEQIGSLLDILGDSMIEDVLIEIRETLGDSEIAVNKLIERLEM